MKLWAVVGPKDGTACWQGGPQRFYLEAVVGLKVGSVGFIGKGDPWGWIHSQWWAPKMKLYRQWWAH